MAEESIDMMPLVNNTIADTDHRDIICMTHFEPNGETHFARGQRDKLQQKQAPQEKNPR